MKRTNCSLFGTKNMILIANMTIQEIALLVLSGIPLASKQHNVKIGNRGRDIPLTSKQHNLKIGNRGSSLTMPTDEFQSYSC
mmetsp:Transcript_27708/g.47975  ORF Transcript_27708/g.47975 Transcript_27708/m.47975 type:complete len:82 (+) Transcript_27708:162-407(+)